MQPRILLIEDDLSTASALKKVLQAEGYGVDLAERGDDGLTQATTRSFDLVLTDLRLPGLGGLELAARLQADKPKLPIIMMTAHGTTDTAIEATKLGVYEYLVKPFEADELLDLVASAVAHSRRMSEPVAMGEARSARFAIIGNSRAMQSIYKEVGRVAATATTVLVRGATGTGKELIARALYQHSDRAEKPFIAVNCAAIPETLLESELFGHERGSFTGAQSRRIGRFEQAHGGTIFLDEIGDLNANTQSKLLRVLQEKSIQRLGGDEAIRVDARVLAATHRDLETAIKEREFREDLYYRLSVVTIRLPALSERAEDIPELVKFFIRRYATELGLDAPSVDPEAVAFLQKQDWPGNVRELENAVRQSLSAGQALCHRPGARAAGAGQVPEAPAGRRPDARGLCCRPAGARATGRGEGCLRRKWWPTLSRNSSRKPFAWPAGNQAKAARWLGVTRLKMREKLTQLGLHPARGNEDR